MLNFPDMSPEELKKCKDEDYCDNYYFFIQIVFLGTTPEMEEIALRKGIIELRATDSLALSAGGASQRLSVDGDGDRPSASARRPQPAHGAGRLAAGQLAAAAGADRSRSPLAARTALPLGSGAWNRDHRLDRRCAERCCCRPPGAGSPAGGGGGGDDFCAPGFLLERVLDFSRFGGDLLSHVLRRSTIGAVALNGRVRKGSGCFTRAMATKPNK